MLPSVWCAGAEYLEIVAGRADFAYFTVSMPWDHAAGALALTVMGGRAAYLDGQPYTPLDESRRGLLVARTPEVWHIVRALLRG